MTSSAPATADVFFCVEMQMRDSVTVIMPIPPTTANRHAPPKTVTANLHRGVHHNCRHTVTGVTASRIFSRAGKVGLTESKHSKRITFCRLCLLGAAQTRFKNHNHSH